MNLFRKFTLAALAVVFTLGLFVFTTNAQYHRDRGWTSGGIYIQYGQPQWQRRRGYINPREYRRLERERYRIYRNSNRYYYNDGYLSERERRRLARQQYRYRRHVYRDRRDW
jgi:hypothetical protein